MSLVLALTRADVGSYVQKLVYVYFVLLFIRVLLTWVPRMPYNRYLDLFVRFLSDVADPYLNLFRRIIPPLRIGGGGIDLSPTVAMFVLLIVGNLIASAIHG
jgi:YggT family protein